MQRDASEYGGMQLTVSSRVLVGLQTASTSVSASRVSGQRLLVGRRRGVDQERVHQQHVPRRARRLHHLRLAYARAISSVISQPRNTSTAPRGRARAAEPAAAARAGGGATGGGRNRLRDKLSEAAPGSGRRVRVQVARHLGVEGKIWERSGRGLGEVWERSRRGLGEVWERSGRGLGRCR